MAGDRGITLYIDPVTYHYEDDRLFDVGSQWHGGQDVLEPYAYLRRWMAERGVQVHTADKLLRNEGLGERNIFVSLGGRERYRRLRGRRDVILSAFIAMECPIVEPRLYRDLDAASQAFRRVYSFSTTEALRPFLKRPIELLEFHIPQSFEHVHEEVWSNRDRRFLTMMNSNKLPQLDTDELYTERLRAVAFFAAREEIDLYGVNWDGAPYRVGDSWVPRPLRRLAHSARCRWQDRWPDPLLAAARSVYKGAAENKAETLGRYRFTLCLENMALDRWVTEKLFDCFYSGTVPIYLGAPDIERWVPPACFIDLRDFRDYDALRTFLHGLSDEEVEGYRRAARDFLGSEQFRPFGKEAHAEVFGRIVEEDLGVVLERGAHAAAAPVG
jgi:hypothetical protein